MPHPAGTQVEGLQGVVALLLLGSEPRLEAQLRISWQRKEEGHSIPGSKQSLLGHPGTFLSSFGFWFVRVSRKSPSFEPLLKL